ncbi:hypothetical protein BDQ17DRAFT_1405087 [Cyathus striatus]|nr:hypothetical protein BDQ17DRAFT_1405087 [Cyathus striatus]
MDDFDDYFDDDIVLDDEALAVLDNEEKRFLSQVVPSALSPPPSKRLKTATSWVPGLGIQTDDTDFEDLPEISVAENGTYDLGTPHPAKPLSYISRETDGKEQPVCLNKHLEELEQRMNELRAENEKMQLALKEATDAKLMKEGEVSVLRKNIEKSYQLHSEQIAKLKAAKEEADAKQNQLQRDMKIELQRLKTQLAFKQQEYEAMTRKPAWNRQHKISPEIPETAARTSNFNDIALVNLPPAPYMRESQNINIQRGSPGKSSYTSPGKSKKPAVLPGFQNSFVTSTPLPQPNFRVAKDKPPSTHEAFDIPSQLGFNFPSPIHPHLSPSDDPAPLLDGDGDVVMDGEEVQTPADNDNTLIKGAIEVDRKLELYQAILAHFLPGHQFTLHILIGLSASDDIAPDLTQSYSSACSTLLELMVGAIESSETYESMLGPLCKILTTMISLLCCSKIGMPLISFLDLLSYLTANFHLFGLSLLDVTLSDRDNGVNILDALFSLLQRLQTLNQPLIDFEDLISSTICSLKVLCFSSDAEHLNKFMCIENYPDVVLYLLHSSRTPAILSQSVSLFIALANKNHESISRTLLKIPDLKCSSSFKGSVDENVCIRRMCLILVGDNPKLESIKPPVLTFFGAVLVSCPDALNIFKKSTWIIPTLVLYLHRLSTPLWRDDESLYLTSSDTLSLVYSMTKILYLLYYLIFEEDTNINMRHKLLHTSSEIFAHISEVYIVTFSRLSFADAPDWLDESAKIELELLSEFLNSDIARELLDLVLDGPDGELAWAAYQRNKDVRPIEQEDADEAWEAELT